MPHTPRSLELTERDHRRAHRSWASTRISPPRPPAPPTGYTACSPVPPSLERVLGPRLDHHAVTWLSERYGSPAALRKAGRRRLVELIRPKAPRTATRLIDDVFDALDEQTVVVPGTGTLVIVIPSLVRSLATVHEQRRALSPSDDGTSFPTAALGYAVDVAMKRHIPFVLSAPYRVSGILQPLLPTDYSTPLSGLPQRPTRAQRWPTACSVSGS